jgi:hypothetical protein
MERAARRDPGMRCRFAHDACRRLAITVAVLTALLAVASPSASANHSAVKLFSVDPPGATSSLDVLGQNRSNIMPSIEVTPDGRHAAYWASTGVYQEALYKSWDGGTELVGVGPKGIADGVLCPGEHYDCAHLISPDGRRVAFETPTSLVDEDADNCSDLGRCDDVYDRIGSSTRLLSAVKPAGDAGHSFLDSMSPDGSRVFFAVTSVEPWGESTGAWEYAGALSPFPSAANHTMSARVHDQGMSRDGRRVIFSTNDSLVPEDADTEDCERYPIRACVDVYKRHADGSVGLLSTGPVASNQPLDAWFEGASADGRRVFFTTKEKLVSQDTDDCFNGNDKPRGCDDLYERSNGVTRLIGGPSGARFAAVTADGRRLFFSTTDSLLSEDSDDCTEGAFTVGCWDVYEETGSGLRLVSRGPGAPSGSFNAGFSGISKDGSHVFFETPEPLVVEDSDGSSLYTSADIYERVGDRTRLVSTGPASPGGEYYNLRFNGVSDDGRRVLFTTYEPLVSGDRDCVNRQWPPACPDVYERFNGTTTLITRGTVDCNSDEYGDEPHCPLFAGMSTDGRRVFFLTPERITPDDTDVFDDLYVATVPPRGCRPDKPGKSPKKCGR